MNHQTDWKLLQGLADDKRDECARKLAEALRERDAAIAKRQLLVDYRSDYERRLATLTTQGIDGERLRNFRRFMTNLEHAIGQQQHAVVAAERRVERAQQAWRDAARTAESYRVLDDRQAARHVEAERRGQQKLNDEFAGRMRLAFRCEGSGND